MSTLFGGFFDTEGFMPHGYCLLWKPSVFWLHLVSDAIIATAYYSIPFALVYFALRRRDLAFRWVFFMFGIFILACGTTHIMGIWTLWNPDYGVDGLVKGFTALVSIATALSLWPLMPQALALASPAQLAQINQDLNRQITERRTAEAAVRQLNDELEQRVHQRSAELAAANALLRAEIQERNQMEARLRQSQKMEAIGQLTGGLAHDFNNFLTVVIGALDRLDVALADRPEERETVQSALSASLRGAELTRKLLAFARKQSLQSADVDLSDLASGMIDLLRRTLGEKIEVEIVGAENLWLARTDSAQAESALANLAINARDAMPRGGRLTIETANVVLDAAYAAENPEVKPGDYVMVAVTDTGAGIPSSDLARVVEPFFTTKAPGEGSGLGLSMVYGFVTQSGGHMKIYSAVGQGTVVRLYFPRAAAAPAVVSPTPAAAVAPAVAASGQLVLVVEDNADVQKTAIRHLTELGYRTVAAASAKDAIAILEKDPGIEVIFTDIVMPGGMNGWELGVAAHRLRPGIPILYTSGFSETTIQDNRAQQAANRFLGKPYRKQDLAQKLQDVLNQA
jgi:signal transduction histidine kinase